MFCPKCGKEIEDESAFCRYCGSNISFKKAENNSIEAIDTTVNTSNSSTSTEKIKSNIFLNSGLSFQQ